MAVNEIKNENIYTPEYILNDQKDLFDLLSENEIHYQIVLSDKLIIHLIKI